MEKHNDKERTNPCKKNLQHIALNFARLKMENLFIFIGIIRLSVVAVLSKEQGMLKFCLAIAI